MLASSMLRVLPGQRVSVLRVTPALGPKRCSLLRLGFPLGEEEHPVSYDALSVFQLRLQDQKDSADPMGAGHKLCASSIEMVIGDWYLDEFGNPTREIKARD